MQSDSGGDRKTRLGTGQQYTSAVSSRVFPERLILCAAVDQLMRRSQTACLLLRDGDCLLHSKPRTIPSQEHRLLQHSIVEDRSCVIAERPRACCHCVDAFVDLLCHKGEVVPVAALVTVLSIRWLTSS